MLSPSIWKAAEGPNYSTNTDKLYHYAELPYLGDYKLVKIPVSLNQLIEHVDYWGEGRVESGDGISGFLNCYNVNHQYQLVSSGPDRDKKIPNRIPVLSYTDCDTSAYIKDESVITVTTSGAHINSSAKDIARIINEDFGSVVVYGVDAVDTKHIEDLAAELQKKSLFPCPGFELPSKLQGLTLYQRHIAFLNVSVIKEELRKNITNGVYDIAVNQSKSLNISNGEVIKELVTNLISTAPRNIMAYAYKLWNSGAKEIVTNHFPTLFQFIFNGDDVTIVNQQYRQALKLDANVDSYNDRLAWGDKSDKSSIRVSWRIMPMWNDNGVTFKLYNVDCNMYLKLDATADNIGDRKCWGSYNSAEVRHRYYLEPSFSNGTLVLFIINCQYQQGLKLAVRVDSYGDRLLWGHNGSVYKDKQRFGWIIANW